MYCTSSSCFKKVLLCNPWTPNSGGLDSSECHLLNDPKQGSTSCRIYVYMCVCVRVPLCLNAHFSRFPTLFFKWLVPWPRLPTIDSSDFVSLFLVLRALYQSLSSSIPNRSNSPYLYNIYTISNTFSDPILSFPGKKNLRPATWMGRKQKSSLATSPSPSNELWLLWPDIAAAARAARAARVHGNPEGWTMSMVFWMDRGWNRPPFGEY